MRSGALALRAGPGAGRSAAGRWPEEPLPRSFLCPAAHPLAPLCLLSVPTSVSASLSPCSLLPSPLLPGSLLFLFSISFSCLGLSRSFCFFLCLSSFFLFLLSVLVPFPFSTLFPSALLILTSLFLLFSPPLWLSYAPAFPHFSCLHLPFSPQPPLAPITWFPAPRLTQLLSSLLTGRKEEAQQALPSLAPPPQRVFPHSLTSLWFPWPKPQSLFLDTLFSLPPSCPRAGGN